MDADLVYQAHLTKQIPAQNTFSCPFERINNSAH